MGELQDSIMKLESKGWTLAAIADAIGHTRITVSRWKSGEHAPTNEKGILLLLHALERRQRIPKRKRYVTPRKRVDGMEQAPTGGQATGV